MSRSKDQNQMKIGIDARFLTHPQPGGFKTYTVNLINALCQKDHDNEYVIYVDRPTVDGVLPQSDNFNYQILPASIPAIGMPFREQILLRRRIAKDKLDIVHSLCNTAPIRVPAKFVLSLLDDIQVRTPQAFPGAKGLESYKRWMINSYSKWTILKTVHKADRVLTLSQYEKEQIVNHLNLAPDRVDVTYFGVNPKFSPASSRIKESRVDEINKTLGLNNRFIMGVGYEPRKNIPLLIESFSTIASRFPDLDLVVIAAQEDRRIFFQSLALNWGISGRVKFLPAQDPSDLAVLYNLADLFVFPSERESFGAPPLEAMACGTPTIAMNMTSLPEILGDGAMLIDGKNVEAWAEAISEVLMNDDVRKKLVVRGLQQAAKFSWERCAQDTINIYRVIQENYTLDSGEPEL